jgi:hypothetical protein
VQYAPGYGYQLPPGYGGEYAVEKLTHMLLYRFYRFRDIGKGFTFTGYICKYPHLTAHLTKHIKNRLKL